MLNDEIVDEVRAVREAHAKSFDYDLRAIFEDLKKSEAARIAAGHPYVQSAVPVPTPSVQRIRFVHR